MRKFIKTINRRNGNVMYVPVEDENSIGIQARLKVRKYEKLMTAEEVAEEMTKDFFKWVETPADPEVIKQLEKEMKRKGF